jgi:phosphatidylglycerol:prolipoprotein diacylglycerol transferase
VWKGGLQFSGGFLEAIAVGLPSFRRWTRPQRWRLLDGMVLGLTVGLGIGRIGCYSVGEHLGGPSNFFLATRYDGGSTREGPLVIGQVIHNTALYELVHLVALAGLLWWLLNRRRASAGTAVGVFLVWYGVARFLTDFLRSYDDTVFGLTGAQWMCLGMLATALWVWAFVRPSLRDSDAVPEGDGAAGTEADEAGADGRSPTTQAAS